MHIRAEFGAMGAAVGQMRSAQAAHEADQASQMNQFMATCDYWDDDAYNQAGLAMGSWKATSSGSSEEVGARSAATQVCEGLYQDGLSAVRSTFAVG